MATGTTKKVVLCVALHFDVSNFLVLEMNIFTALLILAAPYLPINFNAENVCYVLSFLAFVHSKIFSFSLDLIAFPLRVDYFKDAVQKFFFF